MANKKSIKKSSSSIFAIAKLKFVRWTPMLPSHQEWSFKSLASFPTITNPCGGLCKRLFW